MTTKSNSPYRSKLHVPEASSRPDTIPDFSNIDIPSPLESKRPDVLVDVEDERELAYGLVRVLDDDHQAIGEWKPEISASKRDWA